MDLHVTRSPITWVLVADGKTAQIYSPVSVEHRVPLTGTGRHRPTRMKQTLELTPILARPLEAEPPEAYETGRNRTGMVFQSASSARHMAAPHMDARDEVRNQFADRIARLLNTAKMGEAFDRLVLIAPPKMLGEIRVHLTEKILHKVTASLAKEFTHLDEKALAAQLGDVVS